MTRYADPGRCPDCRGTIVFGAAACPSCGLPLVGEPARQLFLTLARADELVTVLRAQAAGGPVAAADVAAPTTAPTASPAAGAAGSVGRPKPVRVRGLSAMSVPRILLGLGAACLLVAALVFLAVTWSRLGVGGRTATLVGFTLAAGALAAWFARRALGAAAESLALVALGLLTLDVFGARSAGWLGEVSTPTFLVLLGVLLAVVGAAAATAVRRTASGELTTAQVVTALGAGVLAVGVSNQDWDSVPAALVVAVLTVAAVTAVTHRLHLRVATAGAAAVAGLTWLALTAVAVGRASEEPTVSAAWLHLHVWPLLAAAALVAAVGLLRLPTPARVVAVAVGHSLTALVLLVPLVDEPPTQVSLGVLGLLVASAAGARLLPGSWWAAGLLTQLAASVTVLASALGLAGAAASRLLDLAEVPWAGSAADRLAAFDPAGLPAPWLLALLLAALAGTAWSVADRLASLLRPGTTPGHVRPWVVLPVAAAVGLLTLALYPVPVWLLVTVPVLAGLASLAAWTRTGSLALVTWAAAFAAAAVVMALHAQWLTLGGCAAALVTSATVLLTARSPWTAAGGGLALGPSLAGLAWTGCALLDVEAPWSALTVLALLAAVFLVAQVPERIGLHRPAEPAELGTAGGAAAAAVPVAVAGVLAAVAPAGWAAAYLTLAGACAVAVGLLRPDRVALRWAGGALLVVASWVRLADLGVEAPEAYTLPAGLALLAVGLHRLRRDPAGGTLTALSPGLALALLPSLLWALADPIHPRSVLLGLACLALVVAGAQVGWTAPLLAGAAAGAVLVVRLAAPYLGDAVPRWALIGAAGAALIATGVTWERRLAEARRVAAYVRRLR